MKLSVKLTLDTRLRVGDITSGITSGESLNKRGLYRIMYRNCTRWDWADLERCSSSSLQAKIAL